MSAKRMNRPATLGELLKSGAPIGDPEKLTCPHCGTMPRLYEVTTPRLGWVLQFYIPAVNCCRAGRRGAV